LPEDQRPDDARSLCFDTPALETPLAILGAPVAELVVSADRPQAKLAIRLCDVWPDGASSRVTFMLFNLTHRDSHAEPRPLEPGKLYRVRIVLNHVAHRFRAGNRIRLAVSSEWWPMMWPAAEQASVTVHAFESRLLLPVRSDRPEDAQWADFGTPETATPVEAEPLREGGVERFVIHDVGSGMTTVRMVKDSGSEYLPTVDVRTEVEHEEIYSIVEGDPLSATAETRGTQHLSREGWQIDTRLRTTMRATENAFHVAAEMDVFENGRRIRSLNESYSIPRDCN